MNLTLARDLLHERGYSLDLRESAWRKRMVCRLYARRGDYARYVCSISDLAKMAEHTFRYKITRLPEASEAAK